MKVLTIPGHGGLVPKHWIASWEKHHPGFTRVDDPDDIEEYVQKAGPEVVLAAHGMGVAAVLKWAAKTKLKIRGAMLVAPEGNSLERFSALPFHSVVVASEDDPHLEIKKAKSLAKQWGSRFIDVGPKRHLDIGLGEWMEGFIILRSLMY